MEKILGFRNMQEKLENIKKLRAYCLNIYWGLKTAYCEMDKCDDGDALH